MGSALEEINLRGAIWVLQSNAKSLSKPENQEIAPKEVLDDLTVGSLLILPKPLPSKSDASSHPPSQSRSRTGPGRIPEKPPLVRFSRQSTNH